MTDKCMICDGRQYIRLPVMYQPLAPAGPISAIEPSRTYPCPECGPTADETRVMVLSCQTMERDFSKKHPGQMDHLLKNHGYALVDRLIRDGAMRTKVVERETSDYPHWPDNVMVRSYVGVVAPAVVASMEKRIVEGAALIVDAVVTEARKRLGNFGSYYRVDSISKDAASRMIGEAASEVLDRERMKIDGEPVRKKPAAQAQSYDHSLAVDGSCPAEES